MYVLSFSLKISVFMLVQLLVCISVFSFFSCSFLYISQGCITSSSSLSCDYLLCGWVFFEFLYSFYHFIFVLMMLTFFLFIFSFLLFFKIFHFFVIFFNYLFFIIFIFCFFSLTFLFLFCSRVLFICIVFFSIIPFSIVSLQFLSVFPFILCFDVWFLHLFSSLFYLAVLYSFHGMYCYLLPYYWFQSKIKCGPLTFYYHFNYMV